MSVFIGTFVHTPALGQLEVLRDHVLQVSPAGLILHLAPAAASAELLNATPASLITRLSKHSFLLPTFTDLHIHAPQYLYAGTGLDLPLMQWLNEYAFRAEVRVDADEGLARRVYKRLGQRMLENGTGAALVFGTIKSESNLILAEVFAGLGIRAYVGKLSMDQNSLPNYIEPSGAAALSSAKSFIDSVKSLAASLPEGQQNLVHPVLTPRFVPTCSDELLEGLGRLAVNEDVRVQSHMCEALDQVEWVRSSREREDEDVFQQTGLLTPRTTQAHCTFLTPETIALVKAQGSSVAHCPLSNAYFSSKILPLRKCLDAEIPVGLGSDIAGGYSLDLQVNMRQAVVSSRILSSYTMPPSDDTLRVNWMESLFLATKGGADALREPNVNGTFKVGGYFDAQLIELASEDGQGTGALDLFDGEGEDAEAWWKESVEKWWCVGDGRNRKGVWVQGRQVF